MRQTARWLDPAMPILRQKAYIDRETSFAAPVLRADQLMSVGRRYLLHVEYETEPNDGLVQRMYDYRGRVMRRFPGVRINQHVIVLGSGQVRGHDDFKANGFALDLKVTYLRDYDPVSFLSDAFLAPFAVLAQGTTPQRKDSFAAALGVIHSSRHPEKRQLLQIADALARIRLEPFVVDQIGKESCMGMDQSVVDFFRGTFWGEEVAAAAQQEGKEVGIELGKEVGIELGKEVGIELGKEVGIELGIGLGREKMLLTQLRAKFGDSPQAERVAHRLAGWDDEAAVLAIMAAKHLESLLDARPPAQAP